MADLCFGRGFVGGLGKRRGEVAMHLRPGPIGLLLEPDTHADVTRFEVRGPSEEAVFAYLYTEALMGTGVHMKDWDVRETPEFRFGIGAVRREAGGRVKWNYAGSGFTLWSPKGPEFGPCEVFLDGTSVGEMDLHAADTQPSQPVLTRDDVPPGYHAVVVRPLNAGRLVIDCLETTG